MLNLIGMLPGLFTTTATAITSITGAIANEKIAALNATTEQDRIAAQERIASLEAMRDAMVAEIAKSKLPIYIQSIMGFVVAIVIIKLLLWDKIVGSIVGCSQAPPGTCGIFTTDKFSDLDVQIILIALGFYFVSSIASTFGGRSK